MDLDAIAVFVKVVETGSFSAAARVLNMPKTTVSAKVAALEKRLGVNLIQRTTRKLRVTEAGEKYFHHCAIAVREVELGEAALQSIQEKPSGLLKITAPVDIGHTVLPGIARAYVEKYPDTQVDIVVTNRVVDVVGEGFDLAIRTGRLKDSPLIARRFFDVRVSLWASPAYLETVDRITHPKHLVKVRFVGLSMTKAQRLIKGTTEAELLFAGRINTDDFETVKALVLLDEGIGALPDFLAADAVAAGRLQPVLPEWKLGLTGVFYFVYAGRKYVSSKVQAFIETAIQMRPS